jgi:hypothetical protein
MAEANQLNSASAWLNQREPRSMGLGRSHLFTAVEAGLDPLVLVFSLWALAFYFEGSVRPAYLILSLIVFSLTFPGSSQLRLPVWKVMFQNRLSLDMDRRLAAADGLCDGVLPQILHGRAGPLAVGGARGPGRRAPGPQGGGAAVAETAGPA